MRGRVLSISELSISKAELDAILRNYRAHQRPDGRHRAVAGQDRGLPRQGHAERLRLVGRPGPALSPSRAARASQSTSWSTTAAASRSSFRPSASCSASKDDRPPFGAAAARAHAHRAADGGDGMRPGGARHRHGLSRPPRAAGGAARGLRRVARRQQGRQHRPRRPPLRPRGRRLHASKPTRPWQGPFPFIAFWNFNHFLVVEGVSEDQGLAQRSRDRAAHASPARNSTRPSPAWPCRFARGPDFQNGGDVPMPDVAPAQSPAGLRLGDLVRRPGSA